MSASEWGVQVLRDMGISAADEFVALDATTGAKVVSDWQSQGQEVGLLVHRLRSALKAQTAGSALKLLGAEAAYGVQIASWLKAELPDVCDGHFGPHPAAVAAVIRLHHEHGRGLTKTRHGASIRAFVRDWESRMLDPADRWFVNRSKGVEA